MQGPVDLLFAALGRLVDEEVDDDVAHGGLKEDRHGERFDDQVGDFRGDIDTNNNSRWRSLRP
jgi:hypothetical protein